MRPLTDRNEVEQQKAKLSVVKDLRENFNKYIRIIANKTYLKKMGESERFDALLPVQDEPIVQKSKQLNKTAIRKFHGVLHAVRVTSYIDILHNFRKKSLTKRGTIDPFPEQAINYLANIFNLETQDVLMLTKISAFFHDSARAADGKDKWDKESAENCYHFMVNKGIEDKIAKFFADAARYKDSPEEFQSFCKSILNNPTEIQLKYCDYIRHLINAADTLDVMRVRTIFDESYLKDFCKTDEHKKNRENANALMKEVRKLIGEQHDLKKGGACRIKLKSGIFLEDESFPQNNDEINIEFDLSEDPYGLMQKKIKESSYYLQELSSASRTLEIEEKEIYEKVYQNYKNYQIAKVIKRDWGKFAPSILKEEFEKQNFAYKLDPLRTAKKDDTLLKARLGDIVPIKGDPHLPKEITTNMSKKTSTSAFSALPGVENPVYSRLFSVKAEELKGDKNAVLVGIIFFSNDPMNDPNLKISLISHNARGYTYERNYYFNNTEKGEEYHQEYGNWKTVEDMFQNSKFPTATNELLARLKFSIHDPRCQVLIGFDNLKSKMIAQLRVVDIKNIANVSFVPVSFYLPSSNTEEKIRPYWLQEQKRDLQTALTTLDVDKQTRAIALMISWFNHDLEPTKLENLIKSFDIKTEFLQLLFNEETSNITKMNFLENFLRINFSQLTKDHKLILIEKIKEQLAKDFTYPLKLDTALRNAIDLACKSMPSNLSTKLVGNDLIKANDFAETYLNAQDKLQQHKQLKELDKLDGKQTVSDNIQKTLEEVSTQLKLLEMPQPSKSYLDKEDGFADFAESYLKTQDELQNELQKHNQLKELDKLDGKETVSDNIQETLKKVSTQLKSSEMPQKPQAIQQESDKYDVTQFIQAIRTASAKNNDKLEQLLEQHYDAIINYRDKGNPKASVLHHVVQHHNTATNNLISIAQKLAINPTIVNAANAIGNTPLFSAIAYKDYDMTKLLLEHGADPNQVNNAGLSPLVKAKEVVKDIKDPTRKSKFLELISEMEKKKDNPHSRVVQ